MHLLNISLICFSVSIKGRIQELYEGPVTIGAGSETSNFKSSRRMQSWAIRHDSEAPTKSHHSSEKDMKEAIGGRESSDIRPKN